MKFSEMIDKPEEIKKLINSANSVKNIILKIVMMDEIFENVEFDGNKNDFIKAINDGEVIKIRDNGKEIYINSSYIMSFEF